MIVVCAGDSFTAGAELWEEKNIPNYKNFTFKQANDERSHSQLMSDAHSKKVVSVIEKNVVEENLSIMLDEISRSRKLKRLDRERDRKNYAYPNILSKELDCEIYNIGISGGSELEIIASAIQKIYELRNLNPDEKIVLIMQHTTVERIWIGDTDNFSLIVSHDYSPTNNISELEFYEVKYTYLSYIPGLLSLLQYDMQVLGVMKICEKLNIDLVQFFTMFDNENKLITNHETCMTKNMSKKLLEHYTDDRYLLPMKHFTCESHELIASWLVEHMKKRSIIDAPNTEVKTLK